MAWIELHQSLTNHRKIIYVKNLLRINKAQAIGHMCLLWLWALDNAQSGDLSGLCPEIIAEAAGWEKDPSKFIEALKTAGFIDANAGIHNWDDYAGKLIERREAEADRKRTYREQHKRATQDNLGASAGRPQDVLRTTRATVPNSTVPYHTDTNTDTITYTGDADKTNDERASVITGDDEPCIESGVPLSAMTTGQEAGMRECSDAYMRIMGRDMSGGMTAEVMLRLMDGVEPPVIAFAMGESKGKSVGYFRAIMRRLAVAGIKTYAQLEATEAKDAQSKAAPKPDYRDPARYEKMNMKGFKEAADDEFSKYADIADKGHG